MAVRVLVRGREDEAAVVAKRSLTRSSRVVREWVVHLSRRPSISSCGRGRRREPGGSTAAQPETSLVAEAPPPGPEQATAKTKEIATPATAAGTLRQRRMVIRRGPLLSSADPLPG